jgi:hypothetical protein
MHRTLRTLALGSGATALALTLALTGCSDKPTPVDGKGSQQAAKEGPTGTEAVEKAKANMKNWESISIIGDVEDDDANLKIEGSGSVKQDGDYKLKVDGTDDGTELSVEIVSVDGKLYMQGSEGFYQENLGDTTGKMAKALSGKYLEVPEEQAGSMSEMSLNGLMSEAFDPDDMETDDLPNPDAKGKLVDFEGIQAYEYEAEDDTTFYLTADGSEQFAGMKSAEDGTVVIKDHNKEVTIEAPSQDDVMTMEDLQKAALGN